MSRAIIELTEHSHVYAVWFAGADGRDMLGTIIRPAPDKPWEVVWRTREHDSDDEKRVYRAVSDGRVSDAEFIEQASAAIELACRMHQHMFGGSWQRIDVDGDGLKAAELLAQQPWSHSKAEGPVD